MNNYFIIPNLKNTFINIFMFSFYLINYKIIAYYAKKTDGSQYIPNLLYQSKYN